MPSVGTSRLNGKKGGRPKGSKAAKTLVKEAARTLVRELVCKELRPLVEAQIRAALGIRHFVLRGPDGKFKRVTHPATITRILNAPKGQYEFFDVWTRDPSTPAFKDLMDRAFGKPAEHVDLVVNDEEERIRRLQHGRQWNARAKRDRDAAARRRPGRSTSSSP